MQRMERGGAHPAGFLRLGCDREDPPKELLYRYFTSSVTSTASSPAPPYFLATLSRSNPLWRCQETQI